MSLSTMFSFHALKPALIFRGACVITTTAFHFPSIQHRFFLPPNMAHHNLIIGLY